MSVKSKFGALALRQSALMRLTLKTFASPLGQFTFITVLLIKAVSMCPSSQPNSSLETNMLLEQLSPHGEIQRGQFLLGSHTCLKIYCCLKYIKKPKIIPISGIFRNLRMYAVRTCIFWQVRFMSVVVRASVCHNIVTLLACYVAGFSRGHGTRECGETHASSRNWFSSWFCGQRSLQCRQNPSKNRSCSGCKVSTILAIFYKSIATLQCSGDNSLQRRFIFFFSIQVKYYWTTCELALNKSCKYYIKIWKRKRVENTTCSGVFSTNGLIETKETTGNKIEKLNANKDQISKHWFERKRALHRHRRGRGFESHSEPEFFSGLCSSSVTARLDYQPLFEKSASVPPPLPPGRVDQTRESGGNRAYVTADLLCLKIWWIINEFDN